MGCTSCRPGCSSCQDPHADPQAYRHRHLDYLRYRKILTILDSVGYWHQRPGGKSRFFGCFDAGGWSLRWLLHANNDRNDPIADLPTSAIGPGAWEENRTIHVCSCFVCCKLVVIHLRKARAEWHGNRMPACRPNRCAARTRGCYKKFGCQASRAEIIRSARPYATACSAVIKLSRSMSVFNWLCDLPVCWT